MKILNPIATIMTTDLITTSPSDKLAVVNKIFDRSNIHHIPVVRAEKLVGMISRSDLLYFLKGLRGDESEDKLNEIRLNNYCVDAIMTTSLAKLSSTDNIAKAIDIFKKNWFHAIPVVDNDKLVGIVTTYDIIAALADQEEEVQS